MLGRNDPGAERRNNIYRFHTLLELLEHYSEFLSAQQMEAVIRDSARVFVEREWASDQETRLQFIKKCENLMEALVAMKESSVRHGLPK
jgi:hypothetical protein